MSILVAYIVVTYLLGLILWFVLVFLNKLTDGMFVSNRNKGVFNIYLFVCWLFSPITITLILFNYFKEALKSNK